MSDARNGEGFAELAGDVDGAGDLLAHHGGLDGGLGGRADGEGPWFCINTAGERWITQGLDDAAADRVVADQGERADRDLPTELVGHHGQDAGNRLSAGSPGRGVGRVRVHHTADLGHVLVDIGMCGRVRGR